MQGVKPCEPAPVLTNITAGSDTIPSNPSKPDKQTVPTVASSNGAQKPAMSIADNQVIGSHSSVPQSKSNVSVGPSAKPQQPHQLTAGPGVVRPQAIMPQPVYGGSPRAPQQLSSGNPQMYAPQARHIAPMPSNGVNMAGVLPGMNGQPPQYYNTPQQYPQQAGMWQQGQIQPLSGNVGSPQPHYQQYIHQQAPVMNNQAPVVQQSHSTSNSFMVDNLLQSNTSCAPSKTTVAYSADVAPAAHAVEDDDEMSSYMTLANSIVSGDK